MGLLEQIFLYTRSLLKFIADILNFCILCPHLVLEFKTLFNFSANRNYATNDVEWGRVFSCHILSLYWPVGGLSLKEISKPAVHHL